MTRIYSPKTLRRFLRRHPDIQAIVPVRQPLASPKKSRKITGAVKRGLDRQFKKYGTRNLALV